MKHFVRIACVLAILGLVLPLGVVQAKTVKFTFGLTGGPKSFETITVYKWQKAMKEASKGELDMNVVAGGPADELRA